MIARLGALFWAAAPPTERIDEERRVVRYKVSSVGTGLHKVQACKPVSSDLAHPAIILGASQPAVWSAPHHHARPLAFPYAYR